MAGRNWEQREVRQAFQFQGIEAKRTKRPDRTMDVAARIWNPSVARRRCSKLECKTSPEAVCAITAESHRL